MREDQTTKDYLDLIVPVYLDINVLLDLLASIEDGFTLVERVTARSSVSSATEAADGAEFGVANILSLFKIDLRASGTKRRGDENAEERQSERYHTYGSLLHRLRTSLFDQGLIKTFDGSDSAWDQLQPSDFVELRGVFRPNPLLESLWTLDRLIEITLLATRIQQSPGGSKKAKHKAGDETTEIGQLRKFLQGIRSDVEKEGIRIYVVELSGGPSCRAVMPLFDKYVRDRSMTELAHGEFRFLGKVVRKLDKESEESIDLLRGTGLGGISDEVLQQLLAAFQQLQAEGLKLPDVRTRIEAPALQVVPIAVYV